MCAGCAQGAESGMQDPASLQQSLADGTAMAIDSGTGGSATGLGGTFNPSDYLHDAASVSSPGSLGQWPYSPQGALSLPSLSLDAPDGSDPADALGAWSNLTDM